MFEEPSRRGGSWLCLGGGAVTTSAPFGVMGIVNLTPDSFYDGGTHDSADLGLAHAMRLHAEGADILDLGAESSRPGAQALTPEQELLRLMPVLRELRREIPGVMLSVDTYHAATAAAVLEEGVQIINDILTCGTCSSSTSPVTCSCTARAGRTSCRRIPATRTSAPRSWPFSSVSCIA